MRWHSKVTGSYLPTSNEAYENAYLAASLLIMDYGWTLEACCGMFGNIDFEGVWNPWRYESDRVLTYQQVVDEYQAPGTNWPVGGGLIGFTPVKKCAMNSSYFPGYDIESYWGFGMNFSDRPGNVNTGYAQIKLIGEAMARGSGNMWIQRKPLSSQAFTQLTDPEDALYYWLWNAEYPANIQQEETRRAGHGLNWYNRLGGSSFTPVNPKGEGGTFPLILILKKGNDHNNGLL